MICHFFSLLMRTLWISCVYVFYEHYCSPLYDYHVFYYSWTKYSRLTEINFKSFTMESVHNQTLQLTFNELRILMKKLFEQDECVDETLNSWFISIDFQCSLKSLRKIIRLLLKLTISVNQTNKFGSFVCDIFGIDVRCLMREEAERIFLLFIFSCTWRVRIQQKIIFISIKSITLKLY